MSIGSALDLSLPLISDTLADVVSKTATALSEIQDVLEQRVTPASLNMNAALPMGGNQLTGVGALTLVEATNPTAAGSVYYDGGEFYAIDSTGTIQLTLNGAINVGATGTIVGDYGGANPARVTYDDASGEYRFTEETNVWADLVCDDVVLKSAAGSVRLGVTNDITTARSVLFKELAASGVSMFVYDTSTSTVEDAATKRATNEVLVTTLNASSNITAPDFKHTAHRYKRVPLVSDSRSYGTSADELYFVSLSNGDKLREIQIKAVKSTGAAMTVDIYRVVLATEATTLIDNDTLATGSNTIIIADHTALGNYEDYLIAITLGDPSHEIHALGVAWTRTV